MTESQNPDPADLGAVDDDDAAIDEALEALTAGMSLTATAEDDEEFGEDTIGEADEFDEPDEDGVGEAGIPDDDAADDLIGDMGGVPVAADAPINFAEPGAEEDEMSALPVAMPEIEFPDDQGRRIARLEQFAIALVDAEATREDGRVKRKVKASATGAATVGAIPVLLQLVGALDLSPELAATATAAAATIASFLTGYATPEREPVLDPVVVHEVERRPRRRRKRR